MKISVALCTHNGMQFLQQQLDSILAQGCPVAEIVVCDDASADDTLLLLQRYAEAYPGLFRIYRNKSNIGVSKNFEQAIHYCTGDIIFFADQDDTWESYKVARTLQFFEQHPGLWGVFSDATLVDHKGMAAGKTIWQHLQFREALAAAPGLDVFRFLLLYRNVVTGACLAIRREAVELVLPFRDYGTMLHDQWIGLTLGAVGKLAYLDECLTQYRVHSGQETEAIWQHTNDDARAFRSALISADASRFPYKYYQYWKKKLTWLYTLQERGIKIDARHFGFVHDRIRDGVLAHVNCLPLPARKLFLIKLLLKKQKEVRLLDILNY